MINEKDLELLKRCKKIYDDYQFVPSTFWKWSKSVIEIAIETRTRLDQAEEHIEKLTDAGNAMKDASLAYTQKLEKRVQELELSNAYLEGALERASQ